MKKEMTLLYKVRGNLYVNLTNRCPCACTFCLRSTRETMDEENHSLWLEREPTVSEVIEEFQKWNPGNFREIVFCGYGEPTERMDAVEEIAAYLKSHYDNPLRVNTNGLGCLIWNRDITPMFQDIDTVSISLNTPDADRYHQLVRSKFGSRSFDAMLDFAKSVKSYVPDVVMTTVATTLTKEEERRCQAICDSIGVTYRIRPWEG